LDNLSGRRTAFNLTILLGNFDQAGAAFGGLILASLVAVLGIYTLHSKEYAKGVTSKYRNVSLAYSREYLETVAVQSIKEKQSGGEFINPTTEQKDISFSTEKRPEEKKVIYKAKPNGLDTTFIAEVTADSGSLYLITDNTLRELGNEGLETRFVVGTVKDVSKAEFVLKPTNGEEEIRIKLPNLVSQPTIGSNVVVAMDSQQMEARRIEELNGRSKTKESKTGGAMAAAWLRLSQPQGADQAGTQLKKVSLTQNVP